MVALHLCSQVGIGHIIQSLILVLYGPAQSDMSCKVRVGPDELKYIIKGGPRVIILIGYGWAQIYYICDLRVGPPPYNIFFHRSLRVGPDILYPLSVGGPTFI